MSTVYMCEVCLKITSVASELLLKNKIYHTCLDCNVFNFPSTTLKSGETLTFKITQEWGQA